MLLNAILFNRFELVSKARDFSVDLFNKVSNDPVSQLFFCSHIVDALWYLQNYGDHLSKTECKIMVEKCLKKINQ